MPLSGKGMLITVMDADPAEEEDFNKWYDREHIVERVAIAGFLEARRYVAALASPKYLNLYSTEKLETLDSPAYRDKLQNATPWTRHHSSKFRNYTRVAARVGEQRSGTWRHARLQPHSPVGIKPKRVAKSHPGAIRFGRWSRPDHLHAPA